MNTITWDSFVNKEPKAAAWIEANASRSNFAHDLRVSVERYGRLTPNQLGAVYRALERPPVRSIETDDRALRSAFSHAQASGLKRPKLHIDGIVVSPAPLTGNNPGALYVKGEDGVYLGKVANGGFMRSRDCTVEQAATVAQLLSSPAEALDAYGKRTGNCGCCNRPLTAAESVQRGIGPICAEKWGLL